jgi:hypothetical protein
MPLPVLMDSVQDTGYPWVLCWIGSNLWPVKLRIRTAEMIVRFVGLYLGPVRRTFLIERNRYFPSCCLWARMLCTPKTKRDGRNVGHCSGKQAIDLFLIWSLISCLIFQYDLFYSHQFVSVLFEDICITNPGHESRLLLSPRVCNDWAPVSLWTDSAPFPSFAARCTTLFLARKPLFRHFQATRRPTKWYSHCRFSNLVSMPLISFCHHFCVASRNSTFCCEIYNAFRFRIKSQQI